MKAVVVTGSAGGIGQAIATRLVKEPALAVLAVDRVTQEVTDNSIVTLQADLASDEGLSAIAAKVEDLGYPLIGLVNNAGITRDRRLVNMTQRELEDVLDVNLGAAFRLSTSLADHIPPGGSIVNISSRAYLGNFGQFNYSMSKGGLVGLTRAMALDLAPSVRVNAIAPGLISTEMARSIPADVLAKTVSSIPMGRMGEPEEVAALVAFLLLGDSSYVTGQVIAIGGGRSLE